MSIVTGALIFLSICISIVLSAKASARIVGGSATGPSQYPHQVSLRRYNSHFCGGSIISSSRILTAAHCMEDHGEIVAVVGTNYLSVSGQSYHVILIVIHPNYESKRISNDIAVLGTDKSILFNSNVQPIDLASSPPSNGATVYVSGWGFLEANGPTPDQLQHAALTILDHESCASTLRKYGKVNTGQLCTISPSGQGTCNGDSGGPLTDASRKQLVGIVSWGAPCGKGFPDVFTNVAFYREWILQQ